jgi:quinol monooxygenase YgiN/enamine deaminase RidA (YjgF/YER057c/UK114 family)
MKNTDKHMKRLMLVAFMLMQGWAFAQGKAEDFVNTKSVQQSRAYSHGIVLRADQARLMTSGIIGTTPSGTLVTAPRAQIKQTFDNIRAILAEAGASVDDIIEIETFLVDTANFLDYALERRDFFKGRKGPPPISKTYYAKSLINPRAVVEIAVMANIPQQQAGDSTIFVTAVVRAKQGMAEALRQALVANISLSRAEAGCLSYELFQSVDDPHIFTLHERWTSRAALNQHFQMPYMKQLSAAKLIATSEIIVVGKVEK